MNLTVVLPLYNKAPYVAETLASIFNQSVLPKQLIIVDDASTDGSLEVVKDWLQTLDPKRDETIQVEIIALDENKGVCHARNLAIKLAVGEWITCIDADDWFEPTVFERAMNAFSRYRFDLLVLQVRYHPSGNVFPDLNEVQPFLKECEPGLYRMEQPLEVICAESHYMGVNVIARKEWMQTEQFDESVTYYEVIDYWYRVVKRILSAPAIEGLGILTGDLYAMREVEGSASRQRYATWRDVRFPPLLRRFRESNEIYDLLLMGVIRDRWFKRSLLRLSNDWQRWLFRFHYRDEFFRQWKYKKLRKSHLVQIGHKAIK